MTNRITDNPPLPHLAAKSANVIPILLVRVLVVLLCSFIFAGLSLELMDDIQGLMAYTLLLLWYLYYEIRYLWSYDNHLFFVNPVVLASVFTFVLTFGITNVLFLLPEKFLIVVGLRPIATPWMNQLMMLVLLGAVAMWVGYTSVMGRTLGRGIQSSSVLKKWMAPALRINKPAIYFCMALSLATTIWAISLGVFGYSSTYDQLIAAANVTQYINMADSLGKMALVAVSLQCFSSPRSASADRNLLLIILGYEVALGLLSGFKSAVAMPFIIVGMTHYSRRNHFPRWLLPSVLAAIVVAYAVIEPFRVARNNESSFNGTSLGSIVSTMSGADALKPGMDEMDNNFFINFFARYNQTYVASLGIEYTANNEELPIGSPEFLGDILLAPAHALLPRFIWEGKSLQNIGTWYTNEILGFEIASSTAMSPFTYLNFAGGPLAIFLGFLFIGILQRSVFDGLRTFGVGGLIVLFGLLGTLVNIDSAFNSIIVAMIRFPPILLILQYMLLRRKKV